jgi:hypothetical protein
VATDDLLRLHSLHTLVVKLEPLAPRLLLCVSRVVPTCSAAEVVAHRIQREGLVVQHCMSIGMSVVSV